MAPRRRPFLLRVDPEILDALQRWANDDLRSLNGHIEYLLRRDLQAAARIAKPRAPALPSESHDGSATGDDAPQADGWG